MATILERIQTAWATGAPLALDRVVEQLASEGHSQTTLEAALETLLQQVRAAGGDENAEEIINRVWDRLTGWCHASGQIRLASPKEIATDVDINKSFDVEGVSR